MFDDAVRGRIEISNSELDDLINLLCINSICDCLIWLPFEKKEKRKEKK